MTGLQESFNLFLHLLLFAILKCKPAASSSRIAFLERVNYLLLLCIYSLNGKDRQLTDCNMSQGSQLKYRKQKLKSA